MPYVRSQRVSEEDAKNFRVDWSRVVHDVHRAIVRQVEPHANFSLRDLVPANDDGPADLELDALLAGLDDAIPSDDLDLDAALADLPLDFPAVRTPVVTDLDGNPVDEEPAPAPTPRRVARNPNAKGSRPRTSFERDKRFLKGLKGVSAVEPVIIAANDPVLSVGEPLPPSAPSSSTPKAMPKGTSKSTEKRRKADQNDTRKAPAWTRTTDIIKGAFSFENVSTRGAGIAWTLNLGNDMIQAANDNPGAFREMMHDRLVKAVAKLLGKRDIVRLPEFTPGGRLHLHGVVDATDDEKVQIENALRRAGGAWAHKNGEEHQALAKVMWGASGWARYSLKAASKARRFFGCTSILSATKGARNRARVAYEAVRATSA